MELKIPNSLMEKYIGYCKSNNILIKPKKMKNVNVLFADIVGFTSMVNVNKDNLFNMYKLMNEIFFNFDIIAKKNNIYKVETIGDCYMAMSGLLNSDTNQQSQANILNFAFEIINFVKNNYANISIRVGIACGDVIFGSLGLIDNKINFIGDCINLASRLQTNTEPNLILVSEYFYELLNINNINDDYEVFDNKKLYAKGFNFVNGYYLQNIIHSQNYNYFTNFSHTNIPKKQNINNFKSSILIIDDCHITIKIMKRKLEKYNINIFTCNSPEEYVNNHINYFYDGIIIDNNYENTKIKGSDLIDKIDNPYTFICLFSSSNINDVEKYTTNSNKIKCIYKPWNNTQYNYFINSLNEYYNDLV